MTPPLPMTAKQEAFLLATLALVQFTAIVDFMVMAPLGPKLIGLWGISTQQFGLAVSAYIFTAGLCGFLAAFFIDAFDRKTVLTFVYAGFTLGTFACGFAPSYEMLLAARVLTGMFGGVLGTMVFSIASDAIPVERRGRAFGIVSASHALASILGVPGGLYFANVFSWHAPFLILGVMSILVQGMIVFAIPQMRGHLNAPHRSPLEVVRDISQNPSQMMALFLLVTLAIGQFSILPFITPYLVINVGILESQLPLIYLVGGICSAFTAPLVGSLSDKFPKAQVYTVSAVLSIIPIFLITHAAHGMSLTIVLTIAAMLFIVISGRIIPAMTLVQGTVLPQHRGSFTSISSAVQQVSAGIGTYCAGIIVRKGADGLLHNYNYIGYTAIVFTIISIVIIRFVKQVDISR